MNKLNNIELSETKLKVLEESISGLGKVGYPFKHKDYELASCIPCSDFSNWIIDRLNEGDIWAIKLLEWEISKGSGFSAGISIKENQMKQKPKELDVYFWSTCIGVNNQLLKTIDKFITTSPKVMFEIMCLLIRTHVSKETAYGYFYDPNDYAYNYSFKTFVDALSCHRLEFDEQKIKSVLGDANLIYSQYMEKYRIEKFISNYFNNEDINIDYSLLEENELSETLSELPIGNRLQFWDLINSSYFISDIRMNRRINLDCWFRTNAFGFDKINSNQNLINAGLIKFLDDTEIILNLLKKKDLLDILCKYDIRLKPQTHKDKIIDKLKEIKNSENDIMEYAIAKGLYYFNTIIEHDLIRLIEYKNQLSKVLLLLCTIDFGFVFRKSHFLNDNGRYYLEYEDGLKERIPLVYGI